MIWLYVFIIISLCFFIFLSSRWIWSVYRSRRQGLHPMPRKATMFDVRRLIIRGETELAVSLYREIFQTTPQEAKKAIEELQRSIQEKKSKLE